MVTASLLLITTTVVGGLTAGPSPAVEPAVPRYRVAVVGFGSVGAGVVRSRRFRVAPQEQPVTVATATDRLVAAPAATGNATGTGGVGYPAGAVGHLPPVVAPAIRGGAQVMVTPADRAPPWRPG
jgi:hypothetical protein